MTSLKPTVTSFEAISEIFGHKTNYQACKRLECSLVWTHFFDKRNIRENSELLPVCNRVPEAIALFFVFCFCFSLFQIADLNITFHLNWITYTFLKCLNLFKWNHDEAFSVKKRVISQPTEPIS